MLIPPSILKALPVCCDPASTRYALGAVAVYRNPDGKPEAVATDGRRLIAATWSEDDPAAFPAIHGLNPAPVAGFSALIPAASCKEAAKMPPKRTPKAILLNVALDETTANGRVAFGATDLDKASVGSAQTIEGRFPKVVQCFPSFEGAVSITVNPYMLAELLKAVADVAGNDDASVTLTIEGPKDDPEALRMVRVAAKGDTCQAVGLLCNRAGGHYTAWTPTGPPEPKEE